MLNLLYLRLRECSLTLALGIFGSRLERKDSPVSRPKVVHGKDWLPAEGYL